MFIWPVLCRYHYEIHVAVRACYKFVIRFLLSTRVLIKWSAAGSRTLKMSYSYSSNLLFKQKYDLLFVCSCWLRLYYLIKFVFITKVLQICLVPCWIPGNRSTWDRLIVSRRHMKRTWVCSYFSSGKHHQVQFAPSVCQIGYTISWTPLQTSWNSLHKENPFYKNI